MLKRLVVVVRAWGPGDLAGGLVGCVIVAVGADQSYGMLAAAPVPFPRVQTDGSAMPFPDASVDGLTCWFALRNFTDLAATLPETARTLRPGRAIALLAVVRTP